MIWQHDWANLQSDRPQLEKAPVPTTTESKTQTMMSIEHPPNNLDNLDREGSDTKAQNNEA